MSCPIDLSCGCFSRLLAWKIKVLIKSMAQIGTESVFWYNLKLNVQASLLGIFHPINMTFISWSIFPSNCSISKGYGLTDYTVFQALSTKDQINLRKTNRAWHVRALLHYICQGSMRFMMPLHLWNTLATPKPSWIKESCNETWDRSREAW